MSDINRIFEQHKNWNIIYFKRINYAIEYNLLNFCYDYQVEISPTDKQFKQLYVYFLLKEILKHYKRNFILPNKLLVLTPLKNSWIIEKHWNQTEYNLFIQRIIRLISKNLPIKTCILHDEILDDRLELSIQSTKISHKKIESFIRRFNLTKIEENIYSIILAN